VKEMCWCNDEYEPECEGETCKQWGLCEFSKQVIKEEGNNYVEKNCVDKQRIIKRLGNNGNQD